MHKSHSFENVCPLQRAESEKWTLRAQDTYTIIFQRSKVIAFSALATSLIFIGHKALVEIYINIGVICGQKS